MKLQDICPHQPFMVFGESKTKLITLIMGKNKAQIKPIKGKFIFNLGSFDDNWKKYNHFEIEIKKSKTKYPINKKVGGKRLYL